MILRILLITIFLVFSKMSLSAQSYARIHLDNLHPKDITILQQLGIALDCGSHIEHHGRVGASMDMTLEVSDQELDWIRQAGYSFTVLIEDLESYYAQRAMRELPIAQQDLEFRKAQALSMSRNAGQDMGCIEDGFFVPQHFQLGSMGGFPTYQELLNTLDSMQILYPTLITTKAAIHDSLTTIEGRPVYYVKISDQPDIDEDEPEVLYTGLHHAREPASAMNLLFYMWYLLEHYDSDPDIQNLVDNRELYFVPVVNPDGYLVNEINNPNGGGLWRKNVRQNLDGSIGVDLNRNYGFEWGVDNIGSSPNGNSSTYRGASAFSEPETQMMKEFTESHTFQTAFHNHSYGNLLLSPWGYTDNVHAEDNLFNTWGNHMTWFNRYVFGQDVLYLVNGEATDWFYGEEITKGKVYAYVPEIGSSQEGSFWPSPLHIIPQCRRQMRMSLLLAYYAGRHALLHDLTPRSLDGLSDSLIFGIERLGLEDGDMTLNITPITSGMIIPQPTQTISNLNRLENRKVSVGYNLDGRIWSGEEIVYEVRLNNGRFDIYSETISKTFRMTEVFADDPDATGMSNWTSSSTWGVSTSKAFSGSQSITDSPIGKYPAGTSYLRLNDTLDFANFSEIYAQYYTHWILDRQSDWVHLASSINSPLYGPECGNYSHRISASPTNINPGMMGTQAGWVLEDHVMYSLAGKDKVSLRFELFADNFGFEDGFYLDDFRIYGKIDCNTTSSTALVSVSPTSGPNMSDGMIDMTISGNTSPYRFRWSTSDTTEDLTGLSSGTYTLAYVDVYGCIDSATVMVEDSLVLSLPTETDMGLRVYPVPAHDMLQIEEGGLPVFSDWQISLHNLHGEDVYQQSITTTENLLSHQIPVRKLIPGMYILMVEGREKRIVRKVMIE